MVLQCVANACPSGSQVRFLVVAYFIIKMQHKLNLKKGITYKICTCGTSKIIPLCDDSHRDLNEETGSNYKSLKITPEEDIELNVLSKNWEDR